mmetsp:Transcript_16304/g.24030  ORF Transcript_16304/g.24030 Transcript_16304/m.24030 type:complete len:90 (+) Transcript_16304:1619-1888(+)
MQAARTVRLSMLESGSGMHPTSLLNATAHSNLSAITAGGLELSVVVGSEGAQLSTSVNSLCAVSTHCCYGGFPSKRGDASYNNCIVNYC